MHWSDHPVTLSQSFHPQSRRGMGFYQVSNISFLFIPDSME